MIALLVTFAAAVASLGSPTLSQTPTPTYQFAAALPSVIDGQPLRALAVDFQTNRLYAGSDVGLYWANLNDPHPKFQGPIFKAHIWKLEMAQDLGRLFYISVEDVGYVDVRANATPRRLVQNNLLAIDIAYEPSRHELYLSMRAPRLMVFDGKSGEPGPTLDLPGWYGFELEAIPGRVFFFLGDTPGLYSVEAATHRVAAWPVQGRLITPGPIEADPSGRHLFMAYDHQVVAIDVATATVVAREPVTPQAIGFDSSNRLLMVLAADPVASLQPVIAYRVEGDKLATVTTTTEPRLGGFAPFLEPTGQGFVLQGNKLLFVWSSAKPAPPRR